VYNVDQKIRINSMLIRKKLKDYLHYIVYSTND